MHTYIDKNISSLFSKPVPTELPHNFGLDYDKYNVYIFNDLRRKYSRKSSLFFTVITELLLKQIQFIVTNVLCYKKYFGSDGTSEKYKRKVDDST